jgi:hypothetical protein
MAIRSLLARLTGWPIITTKYRAHWRVMIHTHPLIVKLLENNADGDARRASLAEWHRAERPVVDVLQGTASLLRIDGPRQLVGKINFAMGALIESHGVTAHLDPVETLHLEERVRQAIEKEIVCWIDFVGLRDCPAVDAGVDRDAADPKALVRMTDWVARNRWIDVHSYVR